MKKDRLTLPWKLGCAACVLLFGTAGGWLIYTMAVLSHDKSINSELGILWDDPKGAPLCIVQAPKNRWMESAFVADASREKGKKIALLVLDDHYRSGDSLYRSESGVIGDPISDAVLCSVPSQAAPKNVVLDPLVQRLISVRCRLRP